MDKRSFNENQQSPEELSSMDIIIKYLRNRSDAEIQYSKNVLRINIEFRNDLSNFQNTNNNNMNSDKNRMVNSKNQSSSSTSKPIENDSVRNKDQQQQQQQQHQQQQQQHQQQQHQQQQQSKNSKQRPTTTANNSNDYLKRNSDHIDIDANKSKKSNNLVNSDDSDDVDEGNSDLLDGKSTYLNGEFICAFKGCTYKSNNIKYLQLHQKTHFSHAKIYPCPKCSAIFLSEPGLHGHAFRNHLSS